MNFGGSGSAVRFGSTVASAALSSLAGSLVLPAEGWPGRLILARAGPGSGAVGTWPQASEVHPTKPSTTAATRFMVKILTPCAETELILTGPTVIFHQKGDDFTSPTVSRAGLLPFRDVTAR
jgi:hypothetical protein